MAKPKMVDLQQIAFFLDTNGSFDNYSWVAKARDRDEAIRSAFSDEEWRALNLFVDDAANQRCDPARGTLAPSLPDNLKSLVAKLIDIGLLSEQAADDFDAINWQPVSSYLASQDYEVLPFDFDAVSRVEKFGRLNVQNWKGGIFVLDASAASELREALSDAGVHSNAEGLYEARAVEGLAEFGRKPKFSDRAVNHGRAVSRETGSKGDGLAYSKYNAHRAAQYILANEPAKFSEIKDIILRSVETYIHKQSYARQDNSDEIKALKQRIDHIGDASNSARKREKEGLEEKLKKYIARDAGAKAAVDDYEKVIARDVQEIRKIRTKDDALDEFLVTIIGPVEDIKSDPFTNDKFRAIREPMFEFALDEARREFLWYVDRPDDEPGVLANASRHQRHRAGRDELRDKLRLIYRWRNEVWRHNPPPLSDIAPRRHARARAVAGAHRS